MLQCLKLQQPTDKAVIQTVQPSLLNQYYTGTTEYATTGVLQDRPVDDISPADHVQGLQQNYKSGRLPVTAVLQKFYFWLVK